MIRTTSLFTCIGIGAKLTAFEAERTGAEMSGVEMTVFMRRK